MLKKIITNIFSGILGILSNRRLNVTTKALIFFDYIKFLCLLLSVTVLNTHIQKVYIRSFRYTVYIHNYLAFFYLFNEIFCKSVYPPLKARTYMDVGANIGMTILWYKIFNPNLEVIAFEPDTYNYQLLLQNVSANHLSRVKVHNIALCDKMGIMPFYTVADPIQNLDSGLTLNQNLPYEKYMVKTDVLSRYIKKSIDLVKIDIEGAEYSVFEELLKTKSMPKIQTILFEGHYFNTAQRRKLTQLIQKLKSAGRVKQLETTEATTIYSYVHR